MTSMSELLDGLVARHPTVHRNAVPWAVVTTEGPYALGVFLAGLVDQTPSPALKQGLCGASFLDRSVWVSLSDLVYSVSWWVCGGVASGCCALRNAGVRWVGPAGGGVIGVGVVVRVWCIVCLVGFMVVRCLSRIEKCAGSARGPARGRACLHSGGPGLLKTGRCTMFSHACSKVGGCRHDLSQQTGLILLSWWPHSGVLLPWGPRETPPCPMRTIASSVPRAEWPSRWFSP